MRREQEGETVIVVIRIEIHASLDQLTVYPRTLLYVHVHIHGIILTPVTIYHTTGAGAGAGAGDQLSPSCYMCF